MPQEAALASTAAAHGVAVCYSGWLGVAVPSRGLTARQALVDPLGADVYVAGTYFPAEDAACTPGASSGQRGGDDCYRHLWRRLDGLAPLAGKALEPMPSYETLEERVARSPHWRAIRAAYNPAKTYQNLTIFSPLLGTQHANVLRELLSYERAYDIMCRGEQRRGALYDRVVFSRLEFHWIGPHPPLASLQRDVIWAPPPDSFGMNDRHAVMPRAAAPDYFRRFSALISPQANRRFALDELVSLNPEAFLKMHLVRWETSTTWGRHLLGEMPLPAFLACCDAKFRVNSTKRCWAQGCEKVMVLPDEAVRTVWAALPKPELARALGVPVSRLQRGDGMGGAITGVANAGTRDGRLGNREQQWIQKAVERLSWRATQSHQRLLEEVGAKTEAPRRRKQLLQPQQQRQRQWRGSPSLVLPVSTPFGELPTHAKADVAWAFRGVLGKYRKEVVEAVRAWRWLQCPSSDGNHQGGLATPRFVVRVDEANPLYERRLQIVVAAADKGLRAERRDDATFVLFNRSYDLALPPAARMHVHCPLTYAPSMMNRGGKRGRAPCDASQLRSPDSQHGWDAVSVSREHIRKLFGKSGKAMLALPTPHVGHCGPTQEGEEGDCLTGNNGNLPFGPGAPPNPMGILTEVDCVRMCAERCARCNYVSISERGHDCSWYHSCDLNALAMEPRWLKHKTYSVAAVKRADAKRFGAVPWDVKPPISQSPSTSLRVGSDDVGPARGAEPTTGTDGVLHAASDATGRQEKPKRLRKARRPAPSNEPHKTRLLGTSGTDDHWFVGFGVGLFSGSAILAFAAVLLRGGPGLWAGLAASAIVVSLAGVLISIQK